MRKTPDDIKKGLECCNEACEWDNGCPYMGLYSECTDGLKTDALTYIQQLEAGIAEWEYVAASPGAVEDMAREIDRLEMQKRQTAKRIQQLEAKVPKWISVEDELPNEYKDVLTFSNDNEILICHYDGHGWIVSFDGCYNDGDVTHWMYLPQDPRTEE